MKHTKMSRRPGVAAMNRALHSEMERSEVERIEQERIDYEHRARLARTNLYGRAQTEANMPRGWVDHKLQ